MAIQTPLLNISLPGAEGQWLLTELSGVEELSALY